MSAIVPEAQQPLIPQEKDSAKEFRPQIRLFKGQIILNPTISKTNFYCFFLFSVMTGGFLVPVGLLGLPLLTNCYGLDNNARLNVVAINQAIALVLQFITAPLLGYLSDKYGRRPLLIMGSIMVFLGVAISPNLPSVYPYYYLLSILTDLGGSFTNALPLLADYIDYEKKGRVAGIAVIIGYLSSYAATEYASTWNLEVDIPSKFHYTALIGFICACFIIPGLKGGQYHKQLYIDQKALAAKRNAAESIRETIEQLEAEHEHQHNEGALNLAQSVYTNEGAPRDPEQAISQRSDNISRVRRRTALDVQNLIEEEPIDQLKPGFRAGVREAQRNPWILLGFIAQFMGTCFTLLLSTLFINYITLMVGNEQAATKAYRLDAIHLLSALVFCTFYAFYADKLNKFKMICTVIILSAISVVLIIIMPSPDSFIAYIAMIIFASASSGYLVFSTQAISKYPNPKYRASTAAISTMCTTLGTTVIDVLGTLLSKSNPLVPFYLYLGICSVGFTAVLVVYYFKKQILNRI